jgi:FtsZ-interacting cell division protein ZipA
MPELRWTLLILGTLFIGGLALWEWRRQRHARGPDNATFDGAGAGERVSPTFDANADLGADASSTYAPARGAFREPTLTFPDVALPVPNDSRDRFADPPVVELDDESLDRLKVEAGEAVDEFSEPAAGEIDPPAPAEPMIPKLSAPVVAPTLAPANGHGAGLHSAREAHREGDWRAAREAPARDLRGDHDLRDHREVPAAHDTHGRREGSAGEAPEFDADEQFAQHDAGAGSGAQRAALDPHDEPTTQFDASGDAPARAAALPLASDSFDAVPAEPIVEWPDEDVRKIIALRLVSGIGERFAGRAVRLALAAEGFVLGKFEIFHKPGPDARAVISAASLTKPGTFSLATMDAQRFGGLSLFAVLPGPLSPLATFDELMTTARALNDRLRGALQDERGEPLTPMRSASIREGLTAAATAAAPVVGAAAAPPVVGSPGSTSPA